jgi:hypothetical protein
MIQSIRAFFTANLVPAITAALALVAALLGSSYFIGLDAIFTLVLFLLVVGATVGAYRLLAREPIAWTEPLQRRLLLTSTLIGVVVVGLAIQAIPYGRDHTNPPVTAEPAWDSAETRALTVLACFDCHSNEVEYPWYSRIAPVSWAVQSHVDSGRSKVNYSEWDRPQKKADESAETVTDGEMPPAYFTRFTHAEARLTDAELQQLIDGLEATFGSEDDDKEDDD